MFRLEVEDHAGQRLVGWVRFGHWFAGMLSYRVEVRWDGPPPRSVPALRDRDLDACL